MSYEQDFKNFLDKYNVMGATSLITSKDKIIKKAYYGYENFETKTPTTSKTIYRVASISKVIVALAIMKLYEEGKLKLDEDISNYLGYKVRNPHFLNDVITIKMLMTQTSSLNDCGDGKKGYYGSEAGFTYIPLKDIIANNNSFYYDQNVWTLNKPGSTFLYCNLGCGILVCIVEKITGKYFMDYLREIMFDPLEIHFGFKLEDIANPTNLATHYSFEDDSFIPYRTYQTFKENQSKLFSLGDNFTGFAGGLYITANDLTKIMFLLMNNGIYKDIRLFKEETIKLMKQVHWQGTSYDEAYKMKGLQLVILDSFKERLYGHFGNAYGLRAFMLFNDNNGYIFISNGGDYLGDGDHLTILLKDVINFMLENKE